MEQSKTIVNDKWIKASVLAGLWAGIEIIAGSFLHNLRIPFSGTILTLISIVLVVGLFQIWPKYGIIWRAGLIKDIKLFPFQRLDIFLQRSNLTLSICFLLALIVYNLRFCILNKALVAEFLFNRY